VPYSIKAIIKYEKSGNYFEIRSFDPPPWHYSPQWGLRDSSLVLYERSQRKVDPY